MPSSFTVAFVLGATPGKWARVWKERLAEVSLNLVACEQEEALTMLRSGAADAALIRLPLDRDFDGDRPLAAIPLYTERAVVVLPKGHVLERSDSVSLTQLEEENILGGGWREVIELVAANIGVAVMPQSVARALIRRDVITEILNAGPEWQVALAWRDGSVDPHVEEFIGIVRGRTARSSRGTAVGGEPGTVTTQAASAKALGKMKRRQERAAASAKTEQGKVHRSVRPGKRQSPKRGK